MTASHCAVLFCAFPPPYPSFHSHEPTRQTTHPKLRSQIIRIRLIDLLPARQHMLQLVMVCLVYALLERVGRGGLLGFEGCEVGGDFVVSILSSVLS